MLKTIKESTIRKIIKNKLLENYKRILLEDNENNQNNYTKLFTKFVNDKWNKDFIVNNLQITQDKLNSDNYRSNIGISDSDRNLGASDTNENNTHFYIKNDDRNNLIDAFENAFKDFKGYFYDASGVNYLTDKSFPFDFDDNTLYQADFIALNKNQKNNANIKVYEEFIKFINNENQADENQADENQTVTNHQSDKQKITALFRIPQLNGGYFELAKILLDTNRMNQLQDISQPGYKPKQFEVQLLKTKGIKQYGFMNSADITTVHNVLTGSSDPKTSDNLKNPKILGKYLADFYMHQMFKVSQYIIISSHLLAYLINRAQNDIQNAQKTFDICKKNGLNKVLKSNIDPNAAIADIQNAADSSNISLEKMFQGRADKNIADITMKASNNVDYAQDKILRDKNINRMKGSARLAKTNPLK